MDALDCCFWLTVTFCRITIFPSSRKDSRSRIHGRDYFDEVQILVIPCNWGRSTVGIISGIIVDVTGPCVMISMRLVTRLRKDGCRPSESQPGVWIRIYFILHLELELSVLRISIPTLHRMPPYSARNKVLMFRKKVHPSQACTNISKHRFRPSRGLEKSSHKGSIYRKPMLRKQLQEGILRKSKQQRKPPAEK
jgi:hypothetical protein